MYYLIIEKGWCCPLDIDPLPTGFQFRNDKSIINLDNKTQLLGDYYE